MPRFKHYNYDQDTMVVINYQEQLQPGTFEHAVHYLIEHKLDLTVFHPKYRNEDTGRLAYDPAILLKIILFAYSKGITEAENGKVRVHFEGRLLQCRHCPKKHQCMQNPASANHRNGSGRQVSFTVENKRLPNYTDWMKHRVDSQQGKELYSHRMSVVEPVFGNIGTNKRLNRFSLRGRKKVQGQWQLYCLVHNIEKLANYGRMAA